jgi:hypothetical protein
MDSIAAKQFLISKIVEEATLENVPLSEIETKMLHFSEAHPSLPDLYEANAEFERNYDSGEYEAKVAALLKSARDRDQKSSPVQGQEWKDTINALQKEDHYILVMVHQAFGAGSAATKRGHRLRDFAIYVAIGVAFVAIVLLTSLWTSAH